MMSGGVCSLRTCCFRSPNSMMESLVQSCQLAFRAARLQRRRRVPSARCFVSSSGAKQKVIVISGPTGAGKSRLALELAKRLNGEIISADSVQVYKGLDVGSAKPSPSDRKEVPHHLVDILHPSEEYSVGQFFEDARQATADILSNSRVPIVSGGTGLYLRWYIYGKPDVPKASREITSQVYSELADMQERGDWNAAVQLVVEAGDPKAQSLASNDWYRLRRSLEIIKSSGAPPSAFQIPYDSFRQRVDLNVEGSTPEVKPTVVLEEIKSKDLDYDFLCFFLSSPRLDLYRSIDLRCENMLLGENGILTEAKWLLDAGLQPNTNSATRAIGYRQAMEYLLQCQQQGRRSSHDDFFAFLSEFQKASRNFAKRQMTWFRNEHIYQWIDASRPLDMVLNFIHDAYHDQTGNREVPTSLKMKKERTSGREASELQSYRTKNRHFIGREDCTDIINWIRSTQCRAQL